MSDLGISPAPWHYDDNREGYEGLCAVYDAEGNVVMGFGDMEDCEWASIADGRICAAAPDLYEALEMLCNGLEWNIENHPTVMNESDREALGQARAALAKAKGKSV
jgi:hypothetical protein